MPPRPLQAQCGRSLPPSFVISSSRHLVMTFFLIFYSKNLHIPNILCIFAPDFRAKLNAGTKRSLLILDHA